MGAPSDENDGPYRYHPSSIKEQSDEDRMNEGMSHEEEMNVVLTAGANSSSNKHSSAPVNPEHRPTWLGVKFLFPNVSILDFAGDAVMAIEV